MKEFEKKEPGNRIELTEKETEQVSGGILHIYNEGKPVWPELQKKDEPKDGGATGGW